MKYIRTITFLGISIITLQSTPSLGAALSSLQSSSRSSSSSTSSSSSSSALSTEAQRKASHLCEELFRVCRSQSNPATVEKVTSLIAAGVDVNAKARRYPKPLVISILNKNKPVVELLLHHGAVLTKEDESSIISENFDSTIVELLILAGSNPQELASKISNQKLHNLCCQQTPLATVKEVAAAMADGADINAQDNYNLSPLYKALSTGNIPVVHFLLEQGASVSTTGTTTLLSLCSDPVVTELLLKAGADPVNSTPDSVHEIGRAIRQSHSAKKVLLLLPYVRDIHHTYTFSSYNPTFCKQTLLDMSLNTLRELLYYRRSYSPSQLLENVNNTVQTIKILLCNGARVTQTSLELVALFGSSSQEKEIADLIVHPEHIVALQKQTINALHLYVDTGTILLDPTIEITSKSIMAGQFPNRSTFWLSIARLCKKLAHSNVYHATSRTSSSCAPAKGR